MRQELTLAALRMAAARRRPAPGLIHHADRGARYAAAYRTALAAIGARCSMSREGGPFNNPPMGNFSETLKAGLVVEADHATRAEARRDGAFFLEAWYNRRSLHSAVGYNTPEQVERTVA